MELNSFHYALSLLETLYGISIPEDLFEEIALTGWNSIGNKRTRLYRYRASVNDCSKSIELPCNADILEAVTTSSEEWNSVTNDSPNGDLNSAAVEAYIESRKSFKNPLYIEGQFIKYERVGNILYFDRPYGCINILYKGVIVDDEGLPELSDKEALALATYTAYAIKYKEGLMTNNANIIQLANTLYQRWIVLVELARLDHYMSQNEWDEVLNAKTSWNRKIHGKSLKLYR